jgi:hypothetical protein
VRRGDAIDEMLERIDAPPVVPPHAPRQGVATGEPAPARTYTRPPIPFEWASSIVFDPEQLREIVEEVFTAGGMSVFYGESNSGKSTLILDLAFRMPDGLPWLGQRSKAGTVIYVGCEGAASIRARLEAYRLHHQCQVGAFGLIPSSLNLMDPSAEVDDLIELIKAKAEELGDAVLLVIVDTVARAMGGANENASEDMARLVSAGDRIREETGAHVCWVHHSGKDAARGARGHSSLRAAVDTEIEVTADETTKTHTLEVTKQRDLGSKGKRLSARFLPIELGLNQWGKPITACVVESIDEASPHVSAVMRAVEQERVEQVTVSAYRRLVEMGVKPTDGRTSTDFLPRQVLDKGLGDGFGRDEIAGAMNRLMAKGVFARGVIGHYGNRTPKFGLVLAGSES